MRYTSLLGAYTHVIINIIHILTIKKNLDVEKLTTKSLYQIFFSQYQTITQNKIRAPFSLNHLKLLIYHLLQNTTYGYF